MQQVSQTYVALAISTLSTLLPLVGVKFDNETLTALVQAFFTIGGIIWALYRRYKVGDITPLGFRK